MELKNMRKGLRVWVINSEKVPRGEQAYGAIHRVYSDYGDSTNLDIAVVLDGGVVINGLNLEDLDYE